MIDETKMIADAKLAGKDYGVFYYAAGKQVFSAERIQQIVAVFDSRPITLSSDVTSWKELVWSSTNPEGVSLYLYVRTADSEDALESTMWSGPFLNKTGESISSQTGRILQFRLAMFTSYDANSGTLQTPLVDNVYVSCYVRGSAQTFYTSAIPLGFVPTHVLVTYNGSIPADTLVQFAVSTSKTIDSQKYKIIQPNQVTDLGDMATEQFIKMSITAVGNTEIPFIIDEFAIAIGGDGFARLGS